MTPSISYELDLDDLRAFWDRSKTTRRDTLVARLVLVAYPLILAALVYGLWLELSRRHPDAGSAAVTGIVIGVIGTLFLVVVFARLARRQMQRRLFAGSVSARGPVALRADEERVEATQAGIVSTMPWSSLVDIETTPRHVFLYLATLQPVIVPRAALEGSELGALIDKRAAIAA